MLGPSASFVRSPTRRSIATDPVLDVCEMQDMATLLVERNHTTRSEAWPQHATRNKRYLREDRDFKVIRFGTEILF